MSKTWRCHEIVEEVLGLLIAKNVTVDEAKIIANTIHEHANTHVYHIPIVGTDRLRSLARLSTTEFQDCLSDKKKPTELPSEAVATKPHE